MSEDLYNIVFAGEILDGMDADEVQEKVGETFRVGGERLQVLFSGQNAVVKRGVDLITATRFQQAFLNAGARAEIEAVIPPPVSSSTPAADPDAFSPPPSDAGPAAESAVDRGDDTGGMANAAATRTDGALSLAPPGAPLDEIDDRGPPRQPDTSGLSLVPGYAWDLSDCAPPPAASPMFDLDAFSLAPLDDRPSGDGQ